MTKLIFVLATAVLSTACAVRAGTSDGVAIPAPAGSQAKEAAASERALKAFDSERELRQAMDSVAKARAIAREKQQAEWREQCLEWAKSDTSVGVSCSGLVQETVTVSGAAAPRESITNDQHSGVDEGGIVKRQGDVLIVLRRGRLFTIGIGGGQLDSLAVADAFGPGTTDQGPYDTWYDELLVWEHTIVVIGFSYLRGGTEIGLFDLGPGGDLRHRATYHLRSYDYYSGSNYASRLIGERLVLFSTSGIPETTDPDAWLPAIRRMQPGETNGSFERITAISRVFRPVEPLGASSLIHTMVVCNVAAPSLTCDATVVLGDALTVFYASPTAAYLWTTAWTADAWTVWPAVVPLRSVLYRMPFDGAPVSAIGVMGFPPSQLAFLEDTHEHLNVVVMHPAKVVTLLRLPLSSFSDGSVDAPGSQYRPLARDLGEWVTPRFVGPYVVVGATSWSDEQKAPRRIVVAEWEKESTASLALTHDAQRIEAIGAHAVVVGTTGDSVSMTAIRLADKPTIAGVLAQPDGLQSENRSHAFFYREDGPDVGVFGLPIVTIRDYDDPREQSARILFVRNRALTLVLGGTLDKSSAIAIDDECRVSCLDWYGNVRPIFIDERIFALIGYEIIEGRLVHGRVEEIRRLDFAPRTERVH